MTRSRSKKTKLFIKVLWGGADLGSVARNMDSVRSISAGRGLFVDIHSAVWPLRDNVSIIERDRGKLYLNPDLAWNGVVQNGGDVIVLDSRKRRRRTVEIKANTTASLRLEDISIAIRTGREHVPYKQSAKSIKKFAPSLLGLIVDETSEKWSFGIACAAAAIVFLAGVTGLKSRHVWHPETLADVDDSLKIPFISPNHFQSAPAVLQDRLDRFHYVSSVSSYYSDLAVLLTDPKALPKESGLFSESVRQYQEQFAEQSDNITQLKASANRLETEVHASGGKIIGIPTVIGESLDGSLQRVLNKIMLIQDAAKGLAELRANVGEQFKGEPAYDYGSAAKTVGDDSLSDFTKKLGEGFRNALPDEEQQVLQAKKYAIDASAAQVKLFGKEYLKSSSQSCCPGIAGIKAGASPIDLDNTEQFERSDEFLAALKASTWGAPKVEEKPIKHIAEPIAGTIDSKAVEKAIATGRFQLQLCFELALRRNQTAKGNMEWQWQIDPRGKINSLSLLSSTLKDEELIHCVKTRIAGWKFPKPKGGSVEIRYPFEFERNKG